MVVHKKGHKNSKGEKAEWCIVSHDTGKILSSHKSKAAAESHLTDMRKFKHMKEDFDSAKKFLENKGYSLLKESADLKSEIRNLIAELFENKIIDSYGDFTDEGSDITAEKCGARYRNFTPIPDGILETLIYDATDEEFFRYIKKLWLPFKNVTNDQYSWAYYLVKRVREELIDNMRYFFNLGASRYEPKLVGNDDMDYEI